MAKHKYFLLLLLFFIPALILRLAFLRTTPAYFSHDEVHYVTEAKSLALTGKDLTGTWRPWYLKPSNPLYAELPSTFMVPAAVLFADPFLQARVTNILFGLIFPLLLGLIGWKLTGQKGVLLATTVLGWFNPWVLEFSRTSFDALPSLTWYSLGLLCLIALPAKWRLTSIIGFWIGFFQYQGLKIVFLPLIVVSVAYVIWRDWPVGKAEKKLSFKELKQHLPIVLKKSADILIIGLLSCLLFGWYLTRLSSQSAGVRVNDILFFNQDYLASRVNEQRRVSLATKLSDVANNKFTVIIQEFLQKYTQTFSPNQLFTQGDSVRSPFSVWTKGFFYPIDALLMAVGIFVMIQNTKWRKVGALLIAFALIAPLPVAVNSIDTWLIFRGSWLIPTLLLVMGIGGWQIATTWPKFLQLSVLGIMLLFGVFFGYEYFYRYPVFSTKGTAFAERVIASYIQRLPKDTKVIVLVDEARFVYTSYLAYSPELKKENIEQIQQSMNSSVYKIGNIEFTTKCFDAKQLQPGTVIINNGVNVPCDSRDTARPNVPYAKIPSLMDNGALFTIYNDPVCSKYVLQPYVHVTQRKQLDVEHLDNQSFCESLLSKPIE